MNTGDGAPLPDGCGNRGPKGKTHGVLLAGGTLGYVGGALSFAVLFAMAIQSWEGFGAADRIWLASLVAAACLSGGWVIAAAAAEGVRPLGHFLMFLGVGAFGILAGQVMDLTVGGYDAPMNAGGLGAVAMGIATWWRHRTSLQLIAVALAADFLVLVIDENWFGFSHAFAVGAIYTALGCFWGFVEGFRWMRPATTARFICYLQVLAGVQIMALAAWHHRILPLSLGCVLSVLLIVTGLDIRRGMAVGFGAIGILVFGPQALSCAFKDLIGISSGLLLAGVLLTALSALIILVRPHLRGEKVA